MRMRQTARDNVSHLVKVAMFASIEFSSSVCGGLIAATSRYRWEDAPADFFVLFENKLGRAPPFQLFRPVSQCLGLLPGSRPSSIALKTLSKISILQTMEHHQH